MVDFEPEGEAKNQWRVKSLASPKKYHRDGDPAPPERSTAVLRRPRTRKFGEITQYKGHYAVQGNSRSPILVSIESSYYASTY